MTRSSTDDIDRMAQQRLVDDEAVGSEQLSGAKRRSITLGLAAREFLRHPSPWILVATLAGSLSARLLVGGWTVSDALVPVVLIAIFPFVEWGIHVGILHWKPRKLGPATLDSLLARKHREHHADPRDIPLIFIPWQTYLWLLPGLAAIALFAFPRLGLGLTYVVCEALIGMVYEWVHYLVHSDYRPKSRAYRAIWRNHRLHHYKNEHYWFGVATSGTADRVLGTRPDPASVQPSRTARALHAGST